jgi:hypothetical protein
MTRLDKSACIIILLCLSSTLLFAQEPSQGDIGQLRNPFESWFSIIERNQKSRATDNGPLNVPEQIKFTLTGIMQGKRNLAIINGEIVSEGDIIEGKKVAQINKKVVILEGDNEKITLEIKDEF